MAFRLRLFLRSVRVLVACMALGMVAAPAPTGDMREAVAWIAHSPAPPPADRTRTANRPAVTREARRERVALAPRRGDLRGTRRRAATSPWGRELAVRDRLYLRHAALLC